MARTHHVFDLQALESRFAIAGRYAARALPANAVVLAVQHSGSIRYSRRPRDDRVGRDSRPDALDRHDCGAARGRARPAFIVLEDAEEPAIPRRGSPAQRFGGLDWPPHAEIHGPVRVRVYDPRRDRGALPAAARPGGDGRTCGEVGLTASFDGSYSEWVRRGPPDLT